MHRCDGGMPGGNNTVFPSGGCIAAWRLDSAAAGQCSTSVAIICSSQKQTLMMRCCGCSQALVCNEAPYSTKCLAAKLMAMMTEFLEHEATRYASRQEVARELEPAAVLASIPQLVRQVMMPKLLWHPEHFHGKTAVTAVLRHLLATTRVLPTTSWAAAFAEVGGTYWLSRLVKDQQPGIRHLAFELLAALTAAPATHAVLSAGWPESGRAACKVATDQGECAEVKAAALHVVVAAMSHLAPSLATDLDSDIGAGPSRHPCTLTVGFMREDASLWAAVTQAAQVGLRLFLPVKSATCHDHYYPLLSGLLQPFKQSIQVSSCSSCRTQPAHHAYLLQLHMRCCNSLWQIQQLLVSWLSSPNAHPT